ncbi:MAG: aspartyl protease family protein [Bacillota bacterium]
MSLNKIQRGKSWRIPFAAYHPMIAIDVYIKNAGKRVFLVDTGAAISIATPRLIPLFGWDPDKPPRRQIISGIGVTRLSIPTFATDRLQIGGLTLGTVELAVVNLPGEVRADGIIGLNVLRNFRVTLEFDTRTLILRPLRKQ